MQVFFFYNLLKTVMLIKIAATQTMRNVHYTSLELGPDYKQL